MTVLEALSRVIRERREQLGLSVAEVGVHRQTVWRLERGEHNPSLTMLWAIAAALDWSPSELLAAVEQIAGPQQ